MTQIVDGYAQPDIEAIKGNEHLIYFVETPNTMKVNAPAIKKSYIWLSKYCPNARVNLVYTVPNRRK